MSRGFRHLSALSPAMLAAMLFACPLPASAQEGAVSFNLPVQPLEASLHAAASASGLNLVVPQRLLTGRTAPALKGTYAPAEALRLLLAGSGLAVTVSGGSAVVTQQRGEVTLAPVEVAATVPTPGSAASGYLVTRTTAAGPTYGDLRLQDAPYSVAVVPSPLIANLQAFQPEQLVKVLPQVTNVLPQENSTGNPFFYVRGFSITQFTNGGGLSYDGLIGGAGGTFATVLEDKERVELLSGVDGFQYGIGSVGGDLNFVLKRPTATPYNSITVGDNAGANGYIHGDFGGPLDSNGIIGYRLNLVEQDGDTSIKNQSIRRNLESGAVDVHLTDDLLFQINGAHSYYHVDGTTPVFGTGLLTSQPAPADPSTLFSPSWSQYGDTTDTAGARLTWTPSEMITVRSAYEYTYDDRPFYPAILYSITNLNGLIKPRLSSNGQDDYWESHALYSFADVKLPEVLGVSNKITFGFSGSFGQSFAGANPISYVGSYPSDAMSLYDLIGEPILPQKITPTPAYRDGINAERNFVIGDELKIGETIEFLLGGDIAAVSSKSYNPAGERTGGYSSSKVTPSLSVIYKPLPWLSAYATYQQSLQSGSTVPLSSGGIPYTNAGAVLPPYVGDQYEVGIKATVATNLLVTAALFDIDKAYEYTVERSSDDAYTEIQDGREIHRGLEITATGKLLDNLTVVGGVTLIDPTIRDLKTTPSYDGTMPQAVSRESGKIYVEYGLPAVPGLTLIGGLQANSWYYGGADDLRKISGYAVADLGLRYETIVYRKPVIFRFNVNNVTNAAYWEFQSYEGQPRTFLGTVEVRF